MKTKEQWISETMESLEGMQRATTDPSLHEKVTARLGQAGRSARLPAVNLLVKIAAGLALLISVNAITLIFYNHSAGTETVSNPLVNEYFSYIKTVTPNP